jgi:hypothetical protein
MKESVSKQIIDGFKRAKKIADKNYKEALKRGYINTQEKRMTLDANHIIKKAGINSLFPKGTFRVVKMDVKNNEVFLKNKHSEFSLVLCTELFRSIHLGEKITMK